MTIHIILDNLLHFRTWLRQILKAYHRLSQSKRGTTNILFESWILRDWVISFDPLFLANYMSINTSEKCFTLAEIINPRFSFNQLTVQEWAVDHWAVHPWVGYLLQLLIGRRDNTISHGSDFVAIPRNRCQALGLGWESGGRLLTIQRIILFNNLDILSSIRMHTRQDVDTWHVDIIIVLVESNVAFRCNFILPLIVTEPARIQSHFLLLKIVNCFVQLVLSFL